VSPDRGLIEWLGARARFVPESAGRFKLFATAQDWTAVSGRADLAREGEGLGRLPAGSRLCHSHCDLAGQGKTCDRLWRETRRSRGCKHWFILIAGR